MPAHRLPLGVTMSEPELLHRRFNRSGSFVLTLKYSRAQHIKPIKKTAQDIVDPFSKNIPRNPIMVMKKPIPSSAKLEIKWLRF